VLEQVDAIGIKKYAAEFNSLETSLARDTFYFAKAANKNNPFAYQVRRAEFDEVLFRNCQKKGVTALEGLTVSGIDLDSSLKTIKATNAQGKLHEFTARYLLTLQDEIQFWRNNLTANKKIQNIKWPLFTVTSVMCLAGPVKMKEISVFTGFNMAGYG